MGIARTTAILFFRFSSRRSSYKPTDRRLLSHCHNRRNVIEYEGSLFEDPRLLNELIEVAGRLLDAVEKLGPIR